MKKETFEEFLQQRHYELYPEILDDDLPDHFNDWLGTLEQDHIINYAQLHGLNQYMAGMDRAEEIRKEANTPLTQ